MKKNQMVNNDNGPSEGALSVNFLVWRVGKLKKKHNEAAHDRVYNDRPRLRDESHH